MVIVVEFNVSCSVGAGQLSDCVPPYVNSITLQAAIRIAICAERRLYGRKVVCPMVIYSITVVILTQIIPPASFVVPISDADMARVLHL